MGQVLTSATPVSCTDQTGGVTIMRCEECPGEGGCIPALSAFGAYPDNKWAGNNQTFYDAIDEASCSQGNIALDKIRLLTLDHAMRHEHKGSGGKRTRLAEAVSRTVMRQLGIRDESLFLDLQDKALSRITVALNYEPGDAALYDFENGTPFFGFIFSYLRRDVLHLLADQDLPIEDLPPASHAEVKLQQDAFLVEVERRRIDNLWEPLVTLDPKLLRFERDVLADIKKSVKARDLKRKKRECLNRAIAIVGRGLEGDKDHCVTLFGGAGLESDGAIYLATIVSNETGRTLYNHKNGATLTAGLTGWLEECIAIFVADADPTVLHAVAFNTKMALDIRKYRKQILGQIGDRRNRLEDEGFSLENWMGPPRIETRGRVENDDLGNSGYGIAASDGLFGCVPHGSYALKRLLLAGAAGADFGGA